MKSRIGVFYDALLTELLDHPVGVEAHLALLDVEKVEVVTVVAHSLHSHI